MTLQTLPTGIVRRLRAHRGRRHGDGARALVSDGVSRAASAPRQTATLLEAIAGWKPRREPGARVRAAREPEKPARGARAGRGTLPARRCRACLLCHGWIIFRSNTSFRCSPDESLGRTRRRPKIEMLDLASGRDSYSAFANRGESRNAKGETAMSEGANQRPGPQKVPEPSQAHCGSSSSIGPSPFIVEA